MEEAGEGEEGGKGEDEELSPRRVMTSEMSESITSAMNVNCFSSSTICGVTPAPEERRRSPESAGKGGTGRPQRRIALRSALDSFTIHCPMNVAAVFLRRFGEAAGAGWE